VAVVASTSAAVVFEASYVEAFIVAFSAVVPWQCRNLRGGGSCVASTPYIEEVSFFNQRRGCAPHPSGTLTSATFLVRYSLMNQSTSERQIVLVKDR